jgi:hypothetical protein
MREKNIRDGSKSAEASQQRLHGFNKAVRVSHLVSPKTQKKRIFGFGPCIQKGFLAENEQAQTTQQLFLITKKHKHVCI